MIKYLGVADGDGKVNIVTTPLPPGLDLLLKCSSKDKRVQNLKNVSSELKNICVG